MRLFLDWRAIGVAVFWGLVAGVAATVQLPLIGWVSSTAPEFSRAQVILFLAVASTPAAVTALVTYEGLLKPSCTRRASLIGWMGAWCFTGILVALFTFLAGVIVMELRTMMVYPGARESLSIYPQVAELGNLGSLRYLFVYGGGTAVFEGLISAIVTLPFAYLLLRR